MVTAKKTIWSLIWSGIEAGGTFGLQFVLMVVMARLLGPKEFGIAAIAYGIIMLLSIPVTGLFRDAIVQRPDLNQQHLDSAFWVSILLAAGAVLFCWIAAPFVSSVFSEPEAGSVLKWMSLSLLAQGASCIHVASLQRELRFKAIAVRNVSAGLVGATVGIVLALRGFGVWSLVGQRLSSMATAAILVWYSSNYRPGIGVSRSALAPLLRFGLPNVAGQFVHNGQQRILTLLIGFFLGTVVVGFVDVAFRLVFSLRRIINSPLYNVSLPLLTRRQNDLVSLRRGLLRGVEYAALLTLPIFAGLGVCAEEVLVLILGPRWLPAAPYVQILCFIAIFTSARSLYGTALVAIGKPQIPLVCMTIGLAISIVALLAYGRSDGVIAMTAWAVGTPLSQPLAFFFTRRYLGVGIWPQFRASVAPLVASAAMVLTLILIKNALLDGVAPGARLLVLVPLGAAVYAVFLTLGKPALIPDFARFVSAGLRRQAVPATK